MYPEIPNTSRIGGLVTLFRVREGTRKQLTYFLFYFTTYKTILPTKIALKGVKGKS